jgi:hypothetical protein
MQPWAHVTQYTFCNYRDAAILEQQITTKQIMQAQQCRGTCATREVES